MNRPKSFKRLLESLSNASFNNDTIDLEIYIDAQRENQRIDSETFLIAENFFWKHGEKLIVTNNRNIGLKEQWLKKANREVPLLILEDDVVVSKYFYNMVKRALHFIFKNEYKNIFGLTLQKMEVVLKRDNCWYTKPQNCVSKFVPKNSNFFLPQFGTWGAVVFNEKWNDLIDFYEMSKKDGTVHCIPGALSNKWYNTSGTFIQYYMYIKGFFFMYINSDNLLLHNYMEKGDHFNGDKKNIYNMTNDSFNNVNLSFDYFFDHGFNILPAKKLVIDPSFYYMNISEKCSIN